MHLLINTLVNIFASFHPPPARLSIEYHENLVPHIPIFKVGMVMMMSTMMVMMMATMMVMMMSTMMVMKSSYEYEKSAVVVFLFF